MQIPALWTQVLTEVQRVFPGAIIAGGALRDLDYGRTVKDVDIFVPTPTDIPAPAEDSLEVLVGGEESYYREQIRQRLETAVGVSVDVNVFSTYKKDTDQSRRIDSVYKMERDGIAFEFIVGDDRACNSNLFDFSICQIEFNGLEISSSEHYKRTKEDRVIRVINERPPKRQAKRIVRMKSKFPEMKIEV